MPQAFQSWYKHDINAWRGSAAVQDMTDAEYRAYHNLLMEQFESEDGMLPADERVLAKLSRKRAEWDSIREVVLEQFESGGNGRIYNVRMHHEWKVSRELSEKRSNGGKKTAGKRWPKAEDEGGSTPPVVQQHSSSSATAQQADGTSPASGVQPVITERNVTLREEQEQPARAALERPNREPSEAEVDVVRMAYPRKTAPPEARKAIRKAVASLRKGQDRPAMTTSEALEFLAKQAAAFARSPAGQAGEYAPHAATWFNRGSYLEDPSEWQRSGDGGRGNGADRKQGNGQQQRPRTAAEQRHHDGLSEIASAFPELAGRGAHGSADGRDEAELREPGGASGMGRIHPITLDGHRGAAWNASAV